MVIARKRYSKAVLSNVKETLNDRSVYDRTKNIYSIELCEEERSSTETDSSTGSFINMSNSSINCIGYC